MSELMLAKMLRVAAIQLQEYSDNEWAIEYDRTVPKGTTVEVDSYLVDDMLKEADKVIAAGT